PNLYNVGNFNADGINKYHSIGTVFTHNFIESSNSRQNNRLSISYVKSGDEKFLNNLSLQNRTTLSNPQLIEDKSISNRSSDNNTIGLNYIKTNSYNDNFSINGNATTTSSNGNSNRVTAITDLSGNMISTNTSESSSNLKSNSQSLSGS